MVSMKDSPRRLTFALASKLVGKCVRANVLPASGGELGPQELLCVLNVNVNKSEVQMIAKSLFDKKSEWHYVDGYGNPPAGFIAANIYKSLPPVKSQVFAGRTYANHVIVFAPSSSVSLPTAQNPKPAAKKPKTTKKPKG